MASPKAVTAYLPPNINLVFVPEKWRDYACWFIGSLYIRGHLEKRRGSKDFRPVSSVVPESIMPKKHYAEIVRLLVTNGVVETGRDYSAGRRCREYRLSEPYLFSKFRVVPLTRKPLVKKLLEQKARWASGKLSRVHSYLRKQMKRLKVEGQPREFDFCLEYLRRGETWFKSDKQGRVYTAMSSVRRASRVHLRVDGERLESIDIGASQPTIIAALLAETPLPCRVKFSIFRRRLGQEWSDEFPTVDRQHLEYFTRSCKDGSLYRNLVAKTGWKYGFAKRRVLACIYNKPHAKPTNASCLLSEAFPEVWSAITRAKSCEYRRVAWLAQTAEAYCVINKACGRIMNEHPKAFVATIHDCLVCQPEYAERFTRILSEEFHLAFGFVPAITRKPF